MSRGINCKGCHEASYWERGEGRGVGGAAIDQTFWGD